MAKQTKLDSFNFQNIFGAIDYPTGHANIFVVKANLYDNNIHAYQVESCSVRLCVAEKHCAVMSVHVQLLELRTRVQIVVYDRLGMSLSDSQLLNTLGDNRSRGIGPSS